MLRNINSKRRRRNIRRSSWVCKRGSLQKGENKRREYNENCCKERNGDLKRVMEMELTLKRRVFRVDGFAASVGFGTRREEDMKRRKD